MSDNKNTGGAAKNRTPATSSSADSGLVIPTLGSQPPQPPILQEGESPDVIAQMNDALLASRARAAAQQEPQPEAPAARPSMADIQRQADAAARSTQAMHRPAAFRRDREQGADNEAIELEMPISGSLDAMRRPDQYIEPVVDFGRFKDKAAELAFLEEILLIRIHETGDPSVEAVVPLGVNGRMVYIRRGEDVYVRRKYVEQLLRAKPENIQTNIRRDGDGNVRNMLTKTRALKYPFSIVQDDNPMGRAWERKIRAEA